MATDTPSTQPQLVKRNDAYTGLLAISFLAMVGGCVLLYLEYDQYENRTPPKMPNIDVPGTLRPAQTPPKEEPRAKPKEVENPENPMPMPMPMMEKDKGGRLPGERSDETVVIPIAIPEPAQLPGNLQTSPVPGGTGSDPIVPVTSTEGRKVLPLEPLEVPPLSAPKTEPAPIIPGLGTEQPPAKIPSTSIPMREPSLEDAPPLKPKPFLPPM